MSLLYVKYSILLTILMDFCSTCYSLPMSGEPKVGSLQFSVTHKLAGNTFHLPRFVLYEETKQYFPQYQTLRSTAGDQRFVETLLGDHPSVSSCCWNSIWDHWSFIGTNCTSQGEISIVPVKPWRLQWADRLNPSHFHYYIFFNKNSNAICEI